MKRRGGLAVRHGSASAAALALLGALGLAGGPPGRADAQVARAAPGAVERSFPPFQVKAAFLYHFGSYVTWPQAKSAADPIRIALLDAPEVTRALERFVVGRTIAGRPVRVRRLRSIRDLGDEELLFIGSEDNPRLDELMRAVGNRPTLVVTDAPDGLAQGAMINFQVVDRRVRFEISLKRARAAGLMLSSRLLSAAFRVDKTSRSGLRAHGAADEMRLADTGLPGGADPPKGRPD